MNTKEKRHEIEQVMLRHIRESMRREDITIDRTAQGYRLEIGERLVGPRLPLGQFHAAMDLLHDALAEMDFARHAQRDRPALDPEPKAKGVRVSVPFVVKEDRVRDLIQCAMEGGIGYWCQAQHYKPDAVELVDICGTLHEDETGCGDYAEEGRLLDAEAIQRGFRVMAERYPWHLRNFVAECEDAETADVFVQCAILGEIVYG